MKVSELMTVAPITVRGDENCRDAAARLCRHHVRHLPVVAPDGTLEGILTDRDLRHHLLSPPVIGRLGEVPVTELLARVRVRDVMSWPVHVTTPDADIAHAAGIMRERRVGALPVVDGTRLAGILSEADLLHHIVGADRSAAECECIVVSYP